MTGINNKQLFETNVKNFKKKFKNIQTDIFLNNKYKSPLPIALLGQIANISQGINLSESPQINSINTNVLYPYFKKGEFKNLKIKKEDISYVDDVTKFNTKDFFNLSDKMLIKRSLTSYTRFSTAFYESKLVFNTNTIGLVINRYGFETKYVLSIISSRYCFNTFYINHINEIEDTKIITLAEIRSIEIPIITLEKQQPFVIITEYILNSNINPEAILFFERLIDAMVYELYFPEQFKNSDIKISDYLNDLPKIDINGDYTLIETVYKKLSNPNNDLNISLLKMLNILVIIDIENHFNHF